mmetsp:Transcript_15608/g.26994  ORF Transcript_15608/g.26994 Transcript_15608/m.26994 type:complete len:110 (+) Transcript_15608:1081-1410(+)
MFSSFDGPNSCFDGLNSCLFSLLWEMQDHCRRWHGYTKYFQDCVDVVNHSLGLNLPAADVSWHSEEAYYPHPRMVGHTEAEWVGIRDSIVAVIGGSCVVPMVLMPEKVG